MAFGLVFATADRLVSRFSEMSSNPNGGASCALGVIRP